MNFVNLTPHTITLTDDMSGGPVISHNIESSGVARVATVRTLVEPTGFWRTVRQTFGEVQGLPAPKIGTVYIVSGMVLSALNGARPDVVAPDTGPDAIRENGQVIAVRGFVV